MLCRSFLPSYIIRLILTVSVLLHLYQYHSKFSIVVTSSFIIFYLFFFCFLPFFLLSPTSFCFSTLPLWPLLLHYEVVLFIFLIILCHFKSGLSYNIPYSQQIWFTLFLVTFDTHRITCVYIAINYYFLMENGFCTVSFVYVSFFILSY